MAFKETGHRAVVSAIETIKSLDMVSSGDRILISVSGGPDSVFLTHILSMLKKELSLKLYGFSLDHSTRDGQSGEDLEFVSRMYKDLGIKIFTRKIDADKWCREHKLSFQEGARKIRMGFLEELAEKHNIDKIALGHNLDDNIETFLMRIIRGSGARGLSGIKPVSGRIIRPLLNTPRQDIEDYLKTNHIDFRVDSSNLEDKYTRNRIRNQLIPFIMDNFPGDLQNSLKRSMDILGQEDEFLKGYALEILKRDAEIQEGPRNTGAICVKFPIMSIGKYHKGLKRRVIQAALELLLGNLEDISFKNIGDILNLIQPENGENRWLKPLGSIIAARIGEYIHLVNTDYMEGLDPDIRSYIKERIDPGSEGKVSGMEQEINIGGYTDLEGFDFIIKSEILSDPGNYSKLPDSKAVMDLDKVKLPIIVRGWTEGDRFYPLGMKGSKKLQDFFIDAKVQVNLRKKIPVVCDREKILWVGNMRIDSRVKATPSTCNFLCLELFEK
jgi:tRNA(Ile)-lysidine synthase